MIKNESGKPGLIILGQIGFIRFVEFSSVATAQLLWPSIKQFKNDRKHFHMRYFITLFAV